MLVIAAAGFAVVELAELDVLSDVAPRRPGNHADGALVPGVKKALQRYHDRREVDRRAPRLRVKRGEAKAQRRVHLKAPRRR